MTYDELPVMFHCAGESLVGIVARPAEPLAVGVVVVVGGPQYRVGSHRQFVHLSRALAAAGIACMRFDYRGMGDSSGAIRTFEDVSDDIRAAIDAFLATLPSVKHVVLWGLCDGASAACFYAPCDPRIAGLVLLNPWIRTDAGEAATYLRHYYWRRLLSADFWRKLVRGGVRIGESLRGLVGFLSRAKAADTQLPLPERVRKCLASYDGRILVVLSENDLVAAEFKDVSGASAAWRQVLHPLRADLRDISGATHTFPSEAWRNEVATATSQWILGKVLTGTRGGKPAGSHSSPATS